MKLSYNKSTRTFSEAKEVVIVTQDWKSGKWKSRSYESEDKMRSSLKQIKNKSSKGFGAYRVSDEFTSKVKKLVNDLNKNTPFAKPELNKWTSKISI